MIAGYIPTDDLPVKRGDEVTIPRGTMVRSTHPAHKGRGWFPYGSTRSVKVDHVLSGQDSRHDAYAIRKGFHLFSNPSVRWAGAGGYWMEADINHVKLPGEEKTLGQTLDLGEARRVHEYGGACELLFHEGLILAGFSRVTGEMVRAPVDDELLIKMQREFFADRGATPESILVIKGLGPRGFEEWFYHEIYARPAAELRKREEGARHAAPASRPSAMRRQ